MGRQWGTPSSNYFSITLMLDTHTSNSRTHAYTDTHTHIIQMQTYTYTHLHTHHIDTHRHRHTHTHTHTPSNVLSILLQWAEQGWRLVSRGQTAFAAVWLRETRYGKVRETIRSLGVLKRSSQTNRDYPLCLIPSPGQMPRSTTASTYYLE